MARATACASRRCHSGDDFAPVVVRVQAALFELAVIGFCLREEGEKASKELVIARFFPLLQSGVGRSGFSKSLHRSYCGHDGQ